jgi:PAS domain S-box-containing protein
MAAVDQSQIYDSFPAAVTVCDADGIISHMNPAAQQLFAKHGGAALIGTNVLDCHPEPARAKLAGLMRDRKSNVYMVEKHGTTRMIYQSPWYADDGAYGGFMELSFEVPASVPKFIK